MRKIKDVLADVYRRADELTGGTLGILRDAFRRFNDAQASHAAAGLAYYTMFSLFPLLLALIAAGSFFLQNERVAQEVVRSVTQAVPISEELIRSNIQRVLERRGTSGLVGLLGLIWSGSGVFTVLTQHVNRAWTDAESRSFLEKRLVALGIVGVLAALLLLSLLSTPTLNLLSRLEVGLGDGVAIYDTPLWSLISHGLPPLFTFLMFLALYRWVPNTDVRWAEAAWGAAFVALAWEGAKRGFAWYVSSGLVQYRLVYGSLGAVVALLLWIYLTSLLALLGAHLSAAISRSR